MQTSVCLFNDFHRTVIVAMVAVLMMQAAVDDIVDMVAVRNGFMTATLAVNVRAAMMGFVAIVRIGFVYFQNMLVIVAVVFVMQMAVVNIVDMVAVFDGGMAAIGTVNMIMILVGMAVAHGRLLVFVGINGFNIGDSLGFCQ